MWAASKAELMNTPGSAGGLTSGCNWIQVRPFQVQVSSRLMPAQALTGISPPNSITTWRAASYTIVSPTLVPYRAGGETGGSWRIQFSPSQSHVSFKGMFPDPLLSDIPPNSTSARIDWS